MHGYRDQLLSTEAAELDRKLEQGLRQLGVPVEQSRRKLLLQYLSLLGKWGRTYNLTGILDPARMITHHVLDSLSTAPYLQGDRLLDVGSGAGLPGIPLAVVFPGLSVTLIESRKKRVQFLVHATTTLGLGNVETICQRVERYRPAAKFDTLVTRAFSSMSEFVNKAGHLCVDDGRMLALKGSYPAAELSGLEHSGFAVKATDQIEVPGVAAQRHIVVLTRSSKGQPDT